MKNNITSQNLVFFQAVFVFVAGAVMLLIPTLLSEHLDTGKLATIKWSGIQYCAIGGLSYSIYRGFSYRETDKKIFLFMMAFHLISAFHIYHMQQLGTIEARWLYAAHFVFAFSFAIVYYLEKTNYHANVKSDENDQNT